MSHEEILNRVSGLAEIIDEACPGPITLVGILDGCIPLLADLSRGLYDHYNRKDIRIETIAISSYTNKTSSKKVSWLKEPKNKLEGTIVIVDEINDSGKTLESVLKYFSHRKDLNIFSCCLLQRESTKTSSNFASKIVPDDLWFLGYGTDDADGTMRNSHNIYIK